MTIDLDVLSRLDETEYKSDRLKRKLELIKLIKGK